jgi:mitogen-activated protein kinase 1/3
MLEKWTRQTVKESMTSAMAEIRPVDAARGIYTVSESGDVTTWNVTRRFTISDWVGGGSYGQVCRGVDRDNGNAPVVIKRISDVFQSADDALRILREVAILRRLDHPNVIKVVDVIEPEPNTDPSTSRSHPFHLLYVVFQDGGMDLAKWSSSAKPHLSADDVRSLMKQMVGAVGYLHRCRVVHRDIKPANILIDPATFTLRIADFGLSRVIEVSEEEEHQGHHHRVWNFERPRAPSVDSHADAAPSPLADSFGSAVPLSRDDSGGSVSDDSDVEDDSPHLLQRWMTQHICTRWYRAPEVILCNGMYSQAVDVWSTGCIFAELLHLMQSPHARPDKDPLFPGRSCFPLSPRAVDRPKGYNPATDKTDQLNVIFSVMGSPSSSDIERLPCDGETKKYLQRLNRVQPTELGAKYSVATAACPLALDLMRGMLQFAPDLRVSSSQALRHDFLNPGHADVSVDSLVGDDGHERAKRTAVKMKQLDIEGLCQDQDPKTRRQKIAQLLRTESELIKLPDTPRERRGHGHRRAPSGASSDGAMDA